jgi:arsenate reductase (thioredoxin)
MQTSRGLHTVVVAMTMIISAAAITDAQSDRQPASREVKPPTVLFLCPHGAAKSVLASAYFQRVAKERGLDVRVDSAGTDPDEQISPAVTVHLTKNGYSIPVQKPRRVTASDLEVADVVISMGCDLKDFPRGRLRRWDEVPAPSEDFARADEAIRKRVVELVGELIRKQGVPK